MLHVKKKVLKTLLEWVTWEVQHSATKKCLLGTATTHSPCVQLALWLVARRMAEEAHPCLQEDRGGILMQN